MGVSRTSRSLSQRQRNFANIYTHTGLARILKQGKINKKMAKIGKLPKIRKLLKIRKLPKIRKSSMLGGVPGLAMILTKGFCMIQFLLEELYCTE